MCPRSQGVSPASPVWHRRWPFTRPHRAAGSISHLRRQLLLNMVALVDHPGHRITRVRSGAGPVVRCRTTTTNIQLLRLAVFADAARLSWRSLQGYHGMSPPASPDVDGHGGVCLRPGRAGTSMATRDARGVGDVMGTDRPVFVLGCPRSGTTHFQLMLPPPPRIPLPPETRFLLTCYSSRNDFGDLRTNRAGVPLPARSSGNGRRCSTIWAWTRRRSSRRSPPGRPPSAQRWGRYAVVPAGHLRGHLHLDGVD